MTVKPPGATVSRLRLRDGMSAVTVTLTACAASSGTSPTLSSAGSSSTTSSRTVATGPTAAGSLAAQALHQTPAADQQAEVLLDHTLATAERWSKLAPGPAH